MTDGSFVVSFVTTHEPFVVGTRYPMTNKSLNVLFVTTNEPFVVGTRYPMTNESFVQSNQLIRDNKSHELICDKRWHENRATLRRMSQYVLSRLRFLRRRYVQKLFV